LGRNQGANSFFPRWEQASPRSHRHSSLQDSKYGSNPRTAFSVWATTHCPTKSIRKYPVPPIHHTQSHPDPDVVLTINSQFPSDIVNAGKETVTLVPGAATFDSSESFGMIRGGHVDVSILGALQVSAGGDLANYMIPGRVFKGMGGAMDLVSNPDNTKIVVATEHVAKDGTSKVVQTCSLPLTGARVVSTIITDLVGFLFWSRHPLNIKPRADSGVAQCVFQVDRKRGTLTLTEIAPGISVEEVKAKTDAIFAVAEDLKTME